MGRGWDGLGELRDDGLEYVKLRWASLRLAAVDRLSTGLAKAFGYVLFLVLVFIALAFLMVALALWIGEMLHSAALGFLIAGGGFVIAAVVMFFVGKWFFANTLVRYFVDLFFTDKDE